MPAAKVLDGCRMVPPFELNDIRRSYKFIQTRRVGSNNYFAATVRIRSTNWFFLVFQDMQPHADLVLRLIARAISPESALPTPPPRCAAIWSTVIKFSSRG